MKKFAKNCTSVLTLIAFIALQIYVGFADVPVNHSLELISKYTLNYTSVDSTGKNSSITLTNAPYQTDGSVYSNGIYSGTSASTIRTPYLSSFNFNSFRISVDFKINSLPTYRKPIIVGGSSYRWIGINVEPNGSISMLWNNSNIKNSSTTIPLGTYNTAMIQYNGICAELYLNGVLACTQSFSLVNGSDSNIQNTNYSNGTTFQGYLKNLIVESAPVLSAIARYTLNYSRVDSTGMNPDITLTNAPFQPNSSVYSNGIYPYGNPSGCTIQTPILSGFNFNNFKVSFEFRVDSLPTYRKPIIVGGSSYRWIGANIDPNGTISMLWNNTNFTSSSKSVPLGTFNTAVIQYNGSVAELYLNGQLACSQAFKPINCGDANFQNTNYSNSSTFLGYIRNLTVYSAPVTKTKAKYTLNYSSSDATGNNSNISLVNSPFQTDGSVYSNGIYAYSAGGSTIQTPYISSLNFNKFSISVDFKINSNPSFRNPIVVGGSSYRWLGINVESNGTISMLWNNSNITSSSKTIPLGVYNTAYIQYNGSTAELYLNGELACTQKFTLQNGGDKNVQNTNYSNGTTFKGYLKNLVIQ